VSLAEAKSVPVVLSAVLFAATMLVVLPLLPPLTKFSAASSRVLPLFLLVVSPPAPTPSLLLL
jgi:hypothetical protein